MYALVHTYGHFHVPRVCLDILFYLEPLQAKLLKDKCPQSSQFSLCSGLEILYESRAVDYS